MATRHSVLPPSEIHVPYSFTAADATALSGLLSGVSDADIGKFCRQTDAEKLFMLTKVGGNFSWKELGSGSGTATTAADVTLTHISGIDRQGEGVTSVQTAVDWLDANKSPQGHTQPINSIINLQTALDGKQDKAEKGQANGYAGLDANSKLLTSVLPTLGAGAVATLDGTGHIQESQLPTNVPLLTGGKLSNDVIPSLAIVDTNVVANNAARDALTGVEKGDVAIVTGDAKSYIYNGSAWVEILAPAGGVTSVFGRTGPAIVAATGDYTADKIGMTHISGVDRQGEGVISAQTAIDWLDANKSPQGHSQPISSVINLQTTLDGKQATSLKNQANGYAGLDANTKIPVSLLPTGTGTGEGDVVVLDSNGKVPVTQVPDLPISQVTNLQTTLTSIQSALSGKADVNHQQDAQSVTLAGINAADWDGTAPANANEALNRIANVLHVHLGVTIPTL